MRSTTTLEKFIAIPPLCTLLKEQALVMGDGRWECEMVDLFIDVSIYSLQMCVCVVCHQKLDNEPFYKYSRFFKMILLHHDCHQREGNSAFCRSESLSPYLHQQCTTLDWTTHKSGKVDKSQTVLFPIPLQGFLHQQWDISLSNQYRGAWKCIWYMRDFFWKIWQHGISCNYIKWKVYDYNELCLALFFIRTRVHDQN